MDTMTILPQLSRSLAAEVSNAAIKKELPPNTEILREGQYIHAIPVVQKGLVKVFTRNEDKELLLYYIRPNESCIMSFSAGLTGEPSKIFAVSEEDTDLLLLPMDRVRQWIKDSPEINSLFYQQYNLRYMELLNTIHDVLFERLDKRLYDYLKEKLALTNTNPLRISHRKIAGEMGTAREVVSRVIKKLENEGKVKQHTNSIEIL